MSNHQKQFGFTLIELLVVTAILGIMVGISSTVFVGILRSQNKTNATNEVRQNANLAIDLFERDIRSASVVTGLDGSLDLTPDTSAAGLGFNGILVELQDGSEIKWYCATTDTFSGNVAIIRDTDDSHEPNWLPGGNSTEEYITNVDPKSGVNMVCGDGTDGAFIVTGTNNQLVTLEFTAKQGVAAPARNDYQIELKFLTTLGIRNSN